MSGFSTVLGHSTDGALIEGVFYGLGVDAEGLPASPAQLNTLIIGLFHGDEGISEKLLRRFIEALDNGSLSAPDWSAHPTLIIPALNPDGLKRRHRGNANGVDLNRNFPATNWEPNDQSSKYFAGPSAASEAETLLMVALLAQYQPRKIISIHSPYKVLNYDGPGKALAEAMAVHCGYEVTADIGYPTPGSFGTYAGIERKIPVVTVELPPNADDPADPDVTLPCETLDEIWPAQAQSLLAAIAFNP